jgi:glutamyl-tRNA reductase
MGRGACSVSSAATDLLKTGFDNTARPNIVFVGVNRMINLAASRWNKLHHGDFRFVNRTVEKATKLAHRFHATGHGLDELPALLPEADIVISCTGASKPLITTPMLGQAMSTRARRGPLTIMDIALPRDVEYSGATTDGLVIYDLEDVKRFVKEHQKAREAAIPEAEELIAQRLGEFAYWYDHARYELGHNGLEPAFEEICREEMSSALDRLPDEYRKEVAQATQRLVRRLAQVKSRADNKTRQ